MEKKVETKDQTSGIMQGLLVDAFSVFCFTYKLYAIQTIWNWLAPKHLGLPTVTFAGVTVLYILRYILIGSELNDIKIIKKYSYISVMLKPNSKTVENWVSFFESSTALSISWFLLKLGWL